MSLDMLALTGKSTMDLVVGVLATSLGSGTIE